MSLSRRCDSLSKWSKYRCLCSSVCVCVCVCADVTCEYDGDELSLGESVTDSDDGCTRW